MIDYETRKKYLEKQHQKNAMEQMFNTFSGQSQQTIRSLQEIHDKAISNLTSEQKKEQAFLEKVGKALVMVFNKIPEHVTLPDVFKIKGNVSIDDLPPVNIDNFSDLRVYFTSLEGKIDKLTKQLQENGKKTEKLQSIDAKINNLDKLSPYFTSLEDKISSLAGYIAKIPPPKITLPEQAFQIPKIELPEIHIPPYPEISFPVQEIVDKLSKIEEVFVENSQKTPELSQINDLLPVMRKIQAGIDNLVSRPTMTPQPVTNVNINALQGFLKTTSNTIGTTATKVPGYGQLFNRRALQIYNNSANTIYYGGSDVTVVNGIPVTPGSFSNVFDCGYNMIVYAIASQANNNIRILEVSKDQTGNVQE